MPWFRMFLLAKVADGDGGGCVFPSTFSIGDKVMVLNGHGDCGLGPLVSNRLKKISCLGTIKVWGHLLALEEGLGKWSVCSEA